MICEKCKTPIPDNAKFCPRCGAKLDMARGQIVQTKKCPSCGAENLVLAKFCTVDGYNFQQADEKPVERHKEPEKPRDVLLCPQCGTLYPLTAKFCRNDGTPLQKVPPPEQMKRPEVTEKEIRPEEIAEPKVEAPAEVKAEEIKPEIEKPKDVILCPKCGTLNPLTAKFCRKDGTPLKEEIKPEVVQPKIKEVLLPKTEVKEEVIKRTSRVWIWLTVSVLILTIAGAGGYLYFSGRVLKRPAGVITTPEGSKPAGSEKAMEETLKPPEKKSAQEEESMVKEPVSPPIREPVPQKPSVDIVDLERNVNSALRNRGLSDVNAKVGKDLTATLKGAVDSPRDKMLASKIAESFKELKEVRNDIVVKASPPPAEAPRPAPAPPSATPAPEVPPPGPPPVSKTDPSKLEGDINGALRNAGLRGIVAAVSDDLQVTLKGRVSSRAEKDRAFEIAKTFKDKGIVRIRDIVFVVEQ